MAQWAVQRQRAMVVRPLFDHLERRGVKQVWLAGRLDMTPQRLHHIKVGIVAAPEGFIEVACAELGITPRDLGVTTRARARKSA